MIKEFQILPTVCFNQSCYDAVKMESVTFLKKNYYLNSKKVSITDEAFTQQRLLTTRDKLAILFTDKVILTM